MSHQLPSHSYYTGTGLKDSLSRLLSSLPLPGKIKNILIYLSQILIISFNIYYLPSVQCLVSAPPPAALMRLVADQNIAHFRQNNSEQPEK